MADLELTDDVRDKTRGAWHHYLGLVMPFRPELHRYCRKLTGDLWDAEDLIQDTLLRGFGTLGSIHHRIRNPRSYLLRIATNLWIDTVRRRGSEADATSAQADEPRASAPSPSQAAEVRDAGAALMQHPAPQERAAILLKDVFDMSLEETADVLRTTIGAVKAALHRGRSRLREPERRAAPRSGPSAALIDRFVERFNARDLPALLEMMLDTASIEGLGFVTENGREAFEREGGWWTHNFEWPAELGHSKPRWERAIFEGEVLALVFSTHDGREALTSVMRFEELDGRVSRIRSYAACPETVREVGEALGLPVQTLGRFPTTPGT